MNDDVERMKDTSLECAAELTLTALTGIKDVVPGDELARLFADALNVQGIRARDDDVLVVSSKIVAKAEGRYVDLGSVVPSPAALVLAEQTQKDPRLVEVILWDTDHVSRAGKDVLIVRHVLGHVSANAGLDRSNVEPPNAPAGSGPWVLRLPRDPDASARALREALRERLGVRVGVVISDSFGRPFRFGTVGVAVGVAGFPALWDQRGRRDLYGRALEHTWTAPADQLAATCDLLLGQAAERRAAAWVRGLRCGDDGGARATDVCRPAAGDLYL